MEWKGRVMALDLGEKRIGIAISDPLRKIAKSYGVVDRKSRKEDFAEYGRIIAEEKITLLIMGLPLMLDGSDSRQTTWVRDYTAELAEAVAVPVKLWDESWTTAQAEASLKARGRRGKKLRDRVDAVAAAFILQSYLDDVENPLVDPWPEDE